MFITYESVLKKTYSFFPSTRGNEYNILPISADLMCKSGEFHRASTSETIGSDTLIDSGVYL